MAHPSQRDLQRRSRTGSCSSFSNEEGEGLRLAAFVSQAPKKRVAPAPSATKKVGLTLHVFGKYWLPGPSPEPILPQPCAARGSVADVVRPWICCRRRHRQKLSTHSSRSGQRPLVSGEPPVIALELQHGIWVPSRAASSNNTLVKAMDCFCRCGRRPQAKA